MPAFGPIKEELADLAGQALAGDFATMVGRTVNGYYREILAYVDQDNQQREFSLTTASGTNQYGLPLYVKRIQDIEDTTNRRSLGEVSPQEFKRRFPGTTSSGTPRSYWPYGTRGVQTQPTSASAITFVSDDTADTTGRMIRVMGFNGSDVLIDEQKTLNGTTSVSTTSNADRTFESVESIVKSTTTGVTIAGNVTVTAGATTLGIIPFWMKSANYQWIELYPKPDAAVTYTVLATMRKPDLVRDDDWPQFDEDYHRLLIVGPGSELLPKTGNNALGGKMFQEYQMLKDQFKSTQNRRPNKAITWSSVSTSYVLPDRPLIRSVDFV